MWKPKVDFNVFLGLHFYILRRGFSLNLNLADSTGWPASELQESTCVWPCPPHTQCWCLQAYNTIPSLMIICIFLIYIYTKLRDDFWLRAFVPWWRTQVRFPAPKWWLIIMYNSRFQEIQHLLLTSESGTYMVYMHTCKHNTYTYQIK